MVLGQSLWGQSREMQGCLRPLGNYEQRLSFPFVKSLVPPPFRQAFLNGEELSGGSSSSVVEADMLGLWPRAVPFLGAASGYS